MLKGCVHSRLQQFQFYAKRDRKAMFSVVDSIFYQCYNLYVSIFR